MRGENKHDRPEVINLGGTSPRARGKQEEVAGIGKQNRNIPACAGKTETNYGSFSSFAEHPRVRGENSAQFSISLSESGTSPRARGKLLLGTVVSAMMRNIPACAGKTSSSALRWNGAKEHPRVRGENCLLLISFWLRAGTSPRARGKHNHRTQPYYVGRNIPACAGKTGFRLVGLHDKTEHPRVRGENLLTAAR